MATKFEDIEEQKLTSLDGSSEQVLGEAFLLDTGKALIEPDLFNEGTYVLHQGSGFVILVDKFKNGNVKFKAIVHKDAETNFDLELQNDREANEHRPADQKCKWNCPPWILALLLFEHDVHPEYDIEKFEKKLYENYPKFWLDEARAPKRLIL